MVHLLLVTLLTTAATSTAATAAPTAPPTSAPAAVRALLQEAEAAADRDLDAAYALIERARSLAAELDDRELELEVLEGHCWFSAVRRPQEVEALLADPGPLPAATRARWTHRLDLCRGWALERSQRAAEALAVYERVVAGVRSEVPDDAATLARALTFRGEQRAALGRYADAIEDLQAAWEFEQTGGNESRQLYLLNAIANLYADRHVGQYERALEEYRRIREAHRRAGRLANLQPPTSTWAPPTRRWGASRRRSPPTARPTPPTPGAATRSRPPTTSGRWR
jgi:tetratricopeptide (TPR) repeat protein